MASASRGGLWARAKQVLLPLWLSWPLVVLGLWFVLLPLVIALDVVWAYYAVGLAGGVAFAFSVRRRYRLTVLERGQGFWVYRLEHLPALARATPAEAAGTAEHD